MDDRHLIGARPDVSPVDRSAAELTRTAGRLRLEGEAPDHSSDPPAAAARGQAKSEGGRGGGPSAGGKQSRRVLVVDDNRDSADTMAELVRLWGHEARTAHDGLAALDVARAFRPQVLLLDVGLPGMDGYELARRLRAEGLAGDLLISITGYGQEEDRQRAREAGFDHHLTKPVSPEMLLRLVGGE